MARYALCVGINNYPGTDMDLSGCVNDARDWAAALEARGFRARTLLDAEATRKRMVESITELIAQARSGDSLVITFSGHGSYELDAEGDEANGFDQALCPHDVNTRGEALVDDDLRRMFERRAARVRLLLVADSCHSGSVNRAPEAEPEAMPRFLPPAKWMAAPRLAQAEEVAARGKPTATLSAGLQRPGASDVLLSGCGDGENDFSYDARFRNRPNGALTYYALKALRDLPPGASYEEWHAEIRKSLPSLRYPQAPQLGGNAQARRLPVLS